MVFPVDALDFADLEQPDRPSQNMRIINIEELGNVEESMAGAQRENTGLVGLVLSVTYGLGNESTTGLGNECTTEVSRFGP